MVCSIPRTFSFRSKSKTKSYTEKHDFLETLSQPTLRTKNVTVCYNFKKNKSICRKENYRSIIRPKAQSRLEWKIGTVRCLRFRSLNINDRISNFYFSPSRRREAPCEVTNLPPRLFTPGETKTLAESKVHQLSRAWVTNGVGWVVILTDLKNMADCHE